MSNSCGACHDNFIVNTKMIKCNFCKSEYHPQCTRIKDSLYKAVIESKNICFFCDGCVEEVKMKLLPGTDNNPEHEEDPPTPKHEMKEHTKTIIATIQETFIDLKTEITTLKESNIDLVRLLSSRDLHETNEKRVHDGKNMKSNKLEKTSEISKIGQERTVKKATFAEKTKNKTSLREINSVVDCEQIEEEPSTVATNAKKKRNNFVKGTGTPNNLLKPAPKGRNWIWIGGLQSDTTAENIQSYAEKQWPNKDILCFDLKSKTPKKSFKFGSSDLSLEELLQPGAWPDGVRVRLFRNLQSIHN